MGDEFNRVPSGFRFNFGGLKVNAPADALPSGKYALATNVRAYEDTALVSRPGILMLFQAATTGTLANQYIIGIRAYAALGTSFASPVLARVLAYDLSGAVWLDNATQVGTMTASPSATPGVSMIPFRPSQSPNPWMYIANGQDYQKFSAPSATNAVTAQKAGIAEPQSAPDAAAYTGQYSAPFGVANPGWVAGGTAGSSSAGTRVSDTAGVILNDPADANIHSIVVSSSSAYQNLMCVTINSQTFIVANVFPAVPGNISVQSIYYFSGTSGHCIIVPNNLANNTQSPYGQNFLNSIQRGTIFRWKWGSGSTDYEYDYVWSVTTGPDGTISIETSTTRTLPAAYNITFQPVIQVVGGTPTEGQTINPASATYQVTSGTGTQTATPADILNPFISNSQSFQENDYITFGIFIDNPNNLTEVILQIDVGDGSFTENYYYYTISPSALQAALALTATQTGAAQTVAQNIIVDEAVDEIVEGAGGLSTNAGGQLAPGASQWTQIVIPVTSLTRVGNDQTKTLQNINNIQFTWIASGTINVATDTLFVFGAMQPDIGDIGAPYQYRVRPRSSVTGVVGNPSPATRYGVVARRAQVIVYLPSAAYDFQIDTWDIFRYGGSVTSWRYIGQTPSVNTTFTDNYDDSAAQAGDALDFDNFEPWPSVDLPQSGTASIINGTIAVISSTNANFMRYLPGTLVELGDNNVYTLYNRPASLGSNNYLLQFVENASAATGSTYLIQEPSIARQFLPYMWGPDATGTIFACGDLLRPGTLYFSKNYAPDSAPDSYNIEITPPSEPLLGGEVLDGLSFVWSSERCWALYPQPQDVRERFSVVQQPFPRGLAAANAHCTDGQVLYWWAKDGIWSSTDGSLTDADLYTLFPHEGVEGQNYTYFGLTYYAPDYTRAASFRLTYSLGFLYAIYQDTTGTYRCLTLDLHRKAWCADNYSPGVSCACHLEQSPQPDEAVTLFASWGGSGTNTQTYVCQQTANENDIGGAITCVVATNEFDGGDIRAPKQWGDLFLDLIPAAAGITDGSTGVEYAPVSLGTDLFTGPVFVPVSSARQRVPLATLTPSQKPLISDFLGLLLAWTDDFTRQSIPTQLIAWQPSFTIQPPYTIAWTTFGSAFGASGYFHLREMMLAWVSSAPVTLTITAYDGTSPAAITIPSSAGAYQKQLFVPTFNKGVLYKFYASSSAPFQLFLDDSEVRVGQWGRQGAYAVSRNFGGASGREAVV